MNPRHVLVWLHWSTHKLEHGIRAFAREADWTLSFMRNTRDFNFKPTQLDGLLTIADPLLNYRNLFPHAKIVDLNGIPNSSMAKLSDAAVAVDHEAVSRIAVEYLYSLGFQRFLIFDCKPVEPVLTRNRSFIKYVKERDGIVRELHLNAWAEQIVCNPQKAKQRISRAIRELKPPFAVYAPEDIYADVFIQAALDLGYQVPEDIAVLGVNNSREICENCRVPISSIDVNLSRVGYEGARLLDGLMNKTVKTNSFVLIPPLTIEKRRSTDDSMQTDRAVQAIRQYIREHFSEHISLQTVLQDLRVSRSTAFAHFTKAVGHPIGKEIMLVRMEHACHLLRHSNYKIDAVSWMCGYKDSSAFGRIFKKIYHQTPSDFRKVNGKEIHK